LPVYKRFHSNSQTIAQHGEEGSEVGVDREAGEDVQRVEGEVYQRTSVSSTRLRFQKIRMEVDASDYITGGVLSMEYEDGKWRSVAFLSKSLNKTERNYKIHDKEMLAVIRGLEN